jgi:hypothetical protein
VTEPRRPKRVFFSWQSDLSQGPTTRAIRAALRTASSEVEAKQSIDITLEEATSNTPGSPYIPYALAEKIRRTDIFVADITTVARLGESTNAKSLPNANVTFELGVASAQIGWSRIIMLFNLELAELKELPFDFDRHRISQFKMKEGEEKAGAAALKALLEAAISRIIIDDPKRPRELEGRSDQEIKRSRDLENMRWFMRHLNTSYLDEHIEEMPTYLNWSAALHDSLGETLRYDNFYRETNNPRKQAFGHNRFNHVMTPEARQAQQNINKARGELKQYLAELIALLRERYLEIDIDETNRRCAKMFDDMSA